MVYNILRKIQIKLIKMNVNIILSYLKLSAFNYCYCSLFIYKIYLKTTVLQFKEGNNYSLNTKFAV